MRATPVVLLLCAAGSCLFSAGCGERVQSATPARTVTEVEVARSKVAEVTDYEEFTGHTDAILSVQVKSRVTGYLLKKNFLDGQEIKEGDLLYEIDDRPYRAVYEGALSGVAQAEAHLRRVEADYARAEKLFRGANIGRQEFDLSTSNYSEAKAAVGVARAALETARLDLEYTKIRAPMSGQLSRTLLDPGNLVRQDTMVLNDIVQADKLYVYFDLNEEGMQRVSELIRLGRVGPANAEQFPVEVGTSVDQDRHDAAEGHLRDLKAIGKKPNAEELVVPPEFPYKGMVNFSENIIDAATGTLRVRAIIDNPSPYILTPGLFVRVRLPIGKPHNEVLISDDAIGSDQGRNFVYVVDADDDVSARTVVLGGKFQGLRAIRQGLKPDERVIVGEGIRRVRPGSKVAARSDPTNA